MITNKILVRFFLEEGCSQDKGEVSAHWTPINFAIYDPLFSGLIEEAIDYWLAENDVKHHVTHEVIFAHEIDIDGAGARLGECFVPILHEQQQY